MNKLDQTFAQLKQLPPELSEQQVLDMIKGLPALPAPKSNWFSNLSFNPIIMNSITLLVIVGTFVLFTPANKTVETEATSDQLSQVASPVPELPENTIEATALGATVAEKAETPLETIVSPQFADQVESAPIMESKNLKTGQVDLNTNTATSPSVDLPESALSESQPSFESISVLEGAQTLAAQSEASISAPVISPITSPVILKKGKQKNKRGKTKKVKTSPPKKNKTKVKSPNRGTSVLDKNKKSKKITRRNYQLKCDAPFPKHDDLRSLKSKLKGELRRQNLFNPNLSVHRISFTSQQILLNRKALSSKQEVRISKILNDYQIFPCDVRIVEITDAYIAAGDITADGFKGHMTGRADLDLIGKMPITDLRPQSGPLQKETRQLGAFHSLETNGLAVVYLSPGDSDVAELEVSGMPMEDLITEVKEGVLKIMTRGQHNGESIKVNISAKTLKSIIVGGASELYSRGPIESEDLRIQVDDVGSAWLEVATGTVNIYMNGGDLFISGKTDNQNLKKTGGRQSHRGSFDNSKLVIKE